MLDSSVREINKSNSEREEMKLKEKQGGREGGSQRGEVCVSYSFITIILCFPKNVLVPGSSLRALTDAFISLFF